ncbi:tol-pal system protein YbgF [Oxalobacter paraformigenes]|uniref:Cell division coordinator CpoB n=1 Tax=Oxalobacter paraformigenes TaxID=556268 RepID=C3X4G9_9BURK|nr:tol-pal system protein YbgF [Oxalobacter paraformigenes]EEO28105.1 tol-pal system protein YbgF [Oxalobacter paraformigenes]
MKKHSRLLFALFLACAWFPMQQAGAALFEDDEARRHILDVRAKLKEVEQEKADKASLLVVANQNEALREEIARLRGQIEVLTNQVATLESRQKDFYLDLDTRLKRLEPQQMTVNGKEVTVEADEGQSYSRAEELFAAADYKGAVSAYSDFLKRFPKSHLAAKAQYQLGNAYYMQGDYKSALKNQSAVVRRYPKNPITPEAMLNMASCQIGLKDLASAKKTLSELVRKYPASEAAKGAKERLAQLG